MNSLKVARALADAAIAEAERRHLTITVCMVDLHGNVVLVQRMDGSILICLEMAQRKAYTAAALRVATADITALDQPGEPLFTLSSVAGGRYVSLGGGLPVTVGDAFLGGLGISGATTEEDIDIAEHALASIEVRNA